MSEEIINDQCKICLEHFPKNDLVSGICGGTDCAEVYFCRTCLAGYFESIVNSGFDGVCLKMRCPSCTRRTVPRKNWESLVNPNVVSLFKDRALKTISIQCANCHQRGSLFVKVDINTNEISVEDHRKQRLDALLALLHVLYPTQQEQNPSSENETSKIEQEEEEEKKIEQTDTNLIYQQLLETSNRYEYDEIPVREMYNIIEKVLHLDDTAPSIERLSIFLRTIEDEERRALLHLRHLFLHPRSTTYCCKRVHCFRCKIRDFHENVTCDQYQAVRNINEEIVLCTQCNISLVKGDGCNSIRCLCGKVMNWEYELGTTRSAAFDATFGPNAGKKAAEAIILSKDVTKPLALIHAQAFQARQQEKYNKGLIEVWKDLFPQFPDETAIYLDQFVNSTEGKRYEISADKLNILRTAWVNTYQDRINQKKQSRKNIEENRLLSLFDGKYSDVHYFIAQNPQMQQIFQQYGMFSSNPSIPTAETVEKTDNLSTIYTEKNANKFIALYGRNNINSIDFERALKWAVLFQTQKYEISPSHKTYLTDFLKIYLDEVENKKKEMFPDFLTQNNLNLTSTNNDNTVTIQTSLTNSGLFSDDVDHFRLERIEIDNSIINNSSDDNISFSLFD